MVTITIFGFLAVWFAYLARFKELRFGLIISFSLIFIFLALRYNFGNDYQGYLQSYINVNRYSEINYFENEFGFEPGWLFLYRISKPIGFFGLTALLSLFYCIVYYRFIKAFVPVHNYWLAVFLYIFSPAFMLIQASAMRQSLAIAIFIFSLNYLFKKDAVRYFLSIYVASLFHSSALVLLPIFFLRFIDWRINKTAALVIISVFILLFVFPSTVGRLQILFVNAYFERYEIYQDFGMGGIGSGLGVIYFSFLLILIMYFENLQDKKTSIIFKIAIISYMFIPLSLPLQFIARLSMYFAPATIIVFPVIQKSIEKQEYKYLFLSTLLIITLLSYIQFFQSDTWSAAYATYKTIFSAPQMY